jgi:predicted metal-dependent peptidase
MTEPVVDFKQADKAITKAKLQLMLAPKSTFFSALLASLRLEITTDIPTAATNGVHLRMNPDFVNTLTDEELLGLLLHEVSHVVYDHCSKIFKDLNHQLLNIAQDHYINLDLLKSGYTLPKGGYADPKYTGLSSMQIYNILLKDPPPDAHQFVMDVEGCPEGTDPKVHQEQVVTNILRAVTLAQIANDPGSIPGDLLIRLEEVINPKLPWQDILAPHMSSYAQNEYSFRRPNRRFMPDFYLPTLYSESLSQITAGVDVSLSMEEEEIKEIFSELVYIWDMLAPDSMRLMTFDTQVHLNKMFTTGDELMELELKGGGGTNVQPLLDSIREETPAFALIFTDGYFGTPNMDGIDTDVYWIIKGNPGFIAPHGVVIPFN